MCARGGEVEGGKMHIHFFGGRGRVRGGGKGMENKILKFLFVPLPVSVHMNSHGPAPNENTGRDECAAHFSPSLLQLQGAGRGGEAAAGGGRGGTGGTGAARRVSIKMIEESSPVVQPQRASITIIPRGERWH